MKSIFSRPNYRHRLTEQTINEIKMNLTKKKMKKIILTDKEIDEGNLSIQIFMMDNREVVRYDLDFNELIKVIDLLERLHSKTFTIQHHWCRASNNYNDEFEVFFGSSKQEACFKAVIEVIKSIT